MAMCPIGDSIESTELDLPVWLASTTTTVQNLMLARTIPADKFFPHTRAVCLPGFTVTVRSMIQSLERVGGSRSLDLIQFKHDETNMRIVSSWPAKFDCSYAMGLGFKVDSDGMDRAIQDYVQMTIE
jgi:hypothetical protein